MARDTSVGREGGQADRRVGHKVAMWSLVDKHKGHREWSKNVEHSLGPRLALECPPHSVPAQETLPSSPDRESRVSIRAPLKSTRGQPRLSHSGWQSGVPHSLSAAWPRPGDPLSRVPSPGTRGIYLLGNATARPGSCSRGPGAPHSHPGWQHPGPARPPPSPHPLRAAWGPLSAGRNPAAHGNAGGPGGALNPLSGGAGRRPGPPGGREGPLSPPSVTNYLDYRGRVCTG